MRWGINLRSDLAKLSDADVASQLEVLMAQREAMYSSVPTLGVHKWLYQLGLDFGRGPLHARAFYRLLGLPYYSPFHNPSLYDLYLLDCELKDVRDEIKYRVALKNAIPAT